MSQKADSVIYRVVIEPRLLLLILFYLLLVCVPEMSLWKGLLHVPVDSGEFHATIS